MLSFSKISIFYLLLSLSCGSIFCRLGLIKLPLLIISFIWNGIMFFHFKKCRKNNKNRTLFICYYISCYYIELTGMSLGWFTNYKFRWWHRDNPGPKSNALNQCFSIFHWKLNGISAHTFTKVSLLSAYISVHRFDITCLSETYLTSKIPSDDENLEIAGYNLVREHLTVSVVESVLPINVATI